MSLALLLAAELKVDVEGGFDVFGLSAPGPYVPEIERLGVTHVPVRNFSRSWGIGQDIRAAYELAAVLRTLRPDILHTHTPKAGVLGRVIGRMTRVPVVVNTCHGLWLRPDDPLPKRVAVLAMEAIAAQASHAELYQNGEDADRLGWAIRGSRARVVGNGIDLDRFRADLSARRRLRNELGVADDELLVVAVGRQVAEKGAHEYAAMATKLAGRARFAWVGAADETKPDAVHEWPASVEVLGNRDDMPAVYSAADVFVLPSHREGFSRSSMEAAACGLPMILTDIRGCREIGVDGTHLVLVRPGDTGALTAAVERLLDDPHLRARLGEAARRYARETFDQRAVAHASLETYLTVARRRRLGWAVPFPTQARTHVGV